MRYLSRAALLAGAVAVALTVAVPAQASRQATDHSDVAAGYGLSVLRPHDEADEGRGRRSSATSTSSRADGQGSSPKQTADIEAAITQGVDGIVISPNEVDALAPALQEAVDAGIPVVTIDRRVDSVPGILAHVGADNVKGGEAQGKLIMKLFPDGATVMNLQGQPGASPAIDRNKGLHNVLDTVSDKYKIVFEDTADFDRAKGLSMTESALAGMDGPPDVISLRQ